MVQKDYKFLYSVNSPADLKMIQLSDLPAYCDEIRNYIIEQCSVNPGHLASSLGAVELAVAIHYVYDTPFDKLVWDVGHQAYAHKIITGRRDIFPLNRKKDGLSGFPRMSESEYDAFGAGHASVSISAAYGMAKASQLHNEQRKVIAVIGDGAMTGGLAFEGLNNAGVDKDTDILVILNDNNMSIDLSQGSLNHYLLRLSTSKRYNRFKQKIWSSLSGCPKLLAFCRRFGNMIKHSLLQNSNFFESLGFRYFGRTNGNDVIQLVKTLRALKGIHSPKLLHTITHKGYGYKPAEENLTIWHAPGKFDAKTGIRTKTERVNDRFQDVFGQTMLDLAASDKRVVGITPAMPSGCSLSMMMEQYPSRCFDVGIAEGHAVTFSAGMATAGARPFCNIYSSFMQRAYDNIIHDVAIQNLPVILCLDRAGLVGEDGATHQGAFDLAYLSCIPNMVVAAPSSELELRNMMYTALLEECPFAIRYPRGEAVGVQWRNQPFLTIPVGKARKLCDGEDVVILAIGPVAHRAKAIAQERTLQRSVAVYDMRYAKPLDEELLKQLSKTYSRFITIEDGALIGGVGERIEVILRRENPSAKVQCLGIPDLFIEQASVQEQYAQCQIDDASIRSAILSI